MKLGERSPRYIERSLSVEEQEYVLLFPVDSAIEIFASSRVTVRKKQFQ
jgi:hypothetical protein